MTSGRTMPDITITKVERVGEVVVVELEIDGDPCREVHPVGARFNRTDEVGIAVAEGMGRVDSSKVL